MPDERQSISDDLIDELVTTAVGNIRPVPVESQWLPIETAPKDGTEILVYRDGEVGVAMFRHPFLDSVEKGEWLGLTMTDAGGRRSCARLEARFPQDVVHSGTPTHWMPLPAPPAITAGTRSAKTT